MSSPEEEDGSEEESLHVTGLRICLGYFLEHIKTKSPKFLCREGETTVLRYFHFKENSRNKGFKCVCCPAATEYSHNTVLQ